MLSFSNLQKSIAAKQTAVKNTPKVNVSKGFIPPGVGRARGGVIQNDTVLNGNQINSNTIGYQKDDAGVLSGAGSNALRYSTLVRNPQNIVAVHSYNVPNFNVISTIYGFYKDPFPLEVQTDSPETITFTSSDPTILKVDGNVITYLQPGNAYVTVYLPAYVSGQQFGNYYSVTQYTNITIVPYPTTITFPDLSTTLSLNPIQFLATSTSKGPIVYISPDTFIAQFTGNNTITVFDEGQITLTADQKAYKFDSAASKIATLTILPADNVNMFRNDFYYNGLDEERSLYAYIENMSQVVNQTDNSVLFTYKKNFLKSRLVQLKYICYLGDLVVEQFTDA